MSHFLLRHVASPAASEAFYTGLLGHPPVESSPSFVMFALSDGLMLGLWARDWVVPTTAAGGGGGGGELAFPVEGRAEVDARHAAWSARGVTVLQSPIDLDFGRSFVAADPDGHWLRVFAPG